MEKIMNNKTVTFTKVFYRENIRDLVEESSFLVKKDSTNADFLYFEPVSTIYEGDYKGFDFKSYALHISGDFLFVTVIFEYDQTDIVQLSKSIFRLCHEKAPFPADYIIENIFQKVTNDSPIYFIRPSGVDIEKESFSDFRDYLLYCKNNIGNTELYSYVFFTYSYQEGREIDKEEDTISILQKAAEGNSCEAPQLADYDRGEVDSHISIFTTKNGCALLREETDDKEDEGKKAKNNEYKKAKNDDFLYRRFYLKYLQILKDMIFFEINARNLNSILDQNNYGNLDELNIRVRRDMRKAVHLKYEIKNALKKNNREEIFWGRYLTNVAFISELDEFIETSHSIEKEIRAKIDEREEAHDKHFDKILSVVAVFAIVSVFKDGSDLILSLISALEEKTFDLSSMVEISAPFLCAISILVILNLFKKK